MVDVGNATLKVHAGTDSTKHLVTGTKNAFKELEFLIQQFIDSGIGFIAAVYKVHDYHIKLLAVAVAAANALLNTLGVPWQVIVNDQRAELQVDTFSTCFCGNHYGAAFFEVLDQCSACVCCFGACDAVGTCMALDPIGIHGLRSCIGVRAIEQDDTFAVGRVGQQ